MNLLTDKLIIEGRQKHLAPSLSISYDNPLHIVRGSGQYLYDNKGKEYLDGVNNIQHVGHCHPEVVRAAREQFGKLNTNTRYLDEIIVKYAIELTSLLPEQLEICYFTNSGSESNDLALRIARHFTSSKETIVLNGAYHGHTEALIEISPYKFDGPGGKGAMNFVHTVPMPDPFRGKHRGSKAANGYLSELSKILTSLKKNGKRLGAIITEAIMGCGGQIVFPKGFLADAFAQVRQAGGLCIADEIQIGFGRMGSHFWGFESEGAVPDIVTVGKSMGNGHPISAVITTKEIADSFNNGMEYFNSFGGNPVSCSVGRAVLQIIQKEELQKRALEVGDYLINRFQNLKRKHSLIGDVRGRGLFIGIELNKNSKNLQPAGREANLVINKMKDKGILLSTDGPDHNVIKIKPPLAFNQQNADFLVETLDSIITEID
ncbi:MAG: aspartate aminotransferase family protein [Candidatus Marinimicrobia bacterium]|nr:aspartate aminotransferase family protein [Candidatus Neomarinimicrobiota bacterium]|tara:strand:- start:17270 stop:18565 length:1296 start_codon:yes stop_codon:yes gene_type:complete